MPNTEKPTAEQAIDSAFEASLVLLDPREEQELAELGMADYAALLGSEAEGATDE